MSPWWIAGFVVLASGMTSAVAPLASPTPSPLPETPCLRIIVMPGAVKAAISIAGAIDDPDGITDSISAVLTKALPRATVFSKEEMTAEVARRIKALEKSVAARQLSLSEVKKESLSEAKTEARRKEINAKADLRDEKITAGLVATTDADLLVTWTAKGGTTNYSFELTVLALEHAVAVARAVASGATPSIGAIDSLAITKVPKLARDVAAKIATTYTCLHFTEKSVKVNFDHEPERKHAFTAELRDLKNRTVDGMHVHFGVTPHAGLSARNVVAADGLAHTTFTMLSKGKYTLMASVERKGMSDATDDAVIDATENMLTVKFKGSVTGQTHGYADTLQLLFFGLAAPPPTVSGAGNSRNFAVDLPVSGTVVLSSGLLDCKDKQPFAATIHLEWGVRNGVAKPVTWKFTDTTGFPLLCKSAAAPALAQAYAFFGASDQGLPSSVFLSAFTNDDAGGNAKDKGIPLTGADPDVQLVLKGQSWAIHYQGSQKFSSTLPVCPVPGSDFAACAGFDPKKAGPLGHANISKGTATVDLQVQLTASK